MQMPTKPLESVLYRELSIAEGKQIIELVSPLLCELVNFGTNALARCATSTSVSGKVDEDVAILALYRHIIEMTDGIQVLLAQSCPNPVIPLLRSSFEALLSMEYILESDKDYTRRSLAWLVGYAHKRIDIYERLDPSTNKGKESKRLFDSDSITARIHLPSVSDVQKAKASLQSFLAKPHIQPIEIEYSKSNGPKWYQLFGGPANLRTLAERLKRGGQYETLYRQWSTTAHAQDFLPFMAKTDTGEQTINRLRSSSMIGEIASFASTFILAATRHIVQKLHPGEDPAPWYRREIRERYRSIAGIED
jgi:hypothetical protein